MKIKICGFNGKLHSWSTIHWALAREWKKLGHSVDIFSTDGIKYFPKDLKDNLIGYYEENKQGQKPNPIIGKSPNINYDMQFSYTAMKNAQHYLKYGSKNRMLQWCFEWCSDEGKNILPQGFATSYRYCDKLLAPSTFVRDYMFIPAGIPAGHIEIIPHGVDVGAFKKTSTIDLPTKKKFKFLFNAAQTHLRKNISGLLEAYGNAFTKNDDVCLILKAKNKKPTASFDVSISDEINKFKTKFINAPEVKLYESFLEDISDLYRSVDCVVSLSHGEGFSMTLLEGIAAGKLVIAPTLGGHTDFINNTNALLVNSKLVKADRKSIYWEPNPNVKWVLPDIYDASEKLKEAYESAYEKNKSIELNKENIYSQYGWDIIAKQVLELCN